MTWPLFIVHFTWYIFLLVINKMHFICLSLFIMFPLSPQAERLMKQIGVEGVSLTEYEMNIATHLVDPRSIKVTTDTFIKSPCASHYNVLYKRHMHC